MNMRIFSSGRRALAAFALVGLVLGGCAGARYDSADLIRAVAAETDVAARYGLDTAWWRAYGNQALDKAVDLALERNVDLAKSALTAQKARYAARLRLSDLIPALSAEGSATSTRNLGEHDAGGERDMYESWAVQGSLNYELDLWQRLAAAHDAASWEYRATLEDLAAARLALINSVVGSWWKIAYLDQAMRLVEGNIAAYARILDIARQRYAQGKAAVVEPLEADQALLTARHSLTTLRVQRAQALQTLRDLCNLRPGEAPPLPDGLDILALVGAPVNLDVPIAALAARPDIRAAESRVQSTFKTVAADRAAWYPRFSVGGSLEATAGSSGAVLDTPLLSGLVRLSLPFLDWNTLWWNLKVSQSEFENAKLQLIQSLTTALNEVDAAYAAYRLDGEALVQLQTVHQRDVHIAAYYQARHAVGRAALKDYLEALATANSSALAALEAHYNRLMQENDVYKAMGGRYTPLRPAQQ